MFKDNIIRLIQPGNVDDQLTEILRTGSRPVGPIGRDRGRGLSRSATERKVMTGLGPVAVHQPCVRYRDADAIDADGIRFSPSILPPYMPFEVDRDVAAYPLPEGYLERRLLRGGWVHKTTNALAKLLPKSQQPKAKRALQAIWVAETKAAASWRSTPSWRTTCPNT